MRLQPAFALGLAIIPGSIAAQPKAVSVARGPMAGEAARARAGRAVSGTCRDEVLNELLLGRRLSDNCDRQRRRAGRAAVRISQAFGFVVSREVDLRAVRLVLGRAVLCRRWPLREGEASVLRLEDVDAAGCRTRRVRTSIPVAVVGNDGTRRERIAVLTPDEDGRVTLAYGDLDLELRARGWGTLEGYMRVEIGEGAWAGVVDLYRLREFRATWHLQWVADGHGSRALFDTRYPELAGLELEPTSTAAESAPASKSE